MIKWAVDYGYMKGNNYYSYEPDEDKVFNTKEEAYEYYESLELKQNEYKLMDENYYDDPDDPEELTGFAELFCQTKRD